MTFLFCIFSASRLMIICKMNGTTLSSGATPSVSLSIRKSVVFTTLQVTKRNICLSSIPLPDGSNLRNVSSLPFWVFTLVMISNGTFTLMLWFAKQVSTFLSFGTYADLVALNIWFLTATLSLHVFVLFLCTGFPVFVMHPPILCKDFWSLKSVSCASLAQILVIPYFLTSPIRCAISWCVLL